jgi:TetR/AcrR family transcriptional regulator, repressor for uid operon
MPKLKPETQHARREHIVDAAERCFARSGFHATTMQDICKEAAVSPGALYVYFASKEELIAGICERDRLEFQAQFEKLAEAPDFFTALRAIGAYYFAERPRHRQIMGVEIGIESTRNPKVGSIHCSVDDYVKSSFEQLFTRMRDEGRIAPDMDMPTLASVFMVIGDGMFWRRAIDPAFDVEKTLGGIVQLMQQLLKPVDGGIKQPGARGAAEAAE